MKNTNLLFLSLMGLLFAACGGLWGSVNKFEVFKSFSLSSNNNETITFQVGKQDSNLWTVYGTKKNDKQKSYLVRKSDKSKFEVDDKTFTLNSKLVGQADATTDWKNNWRSCTYQEYETICDGQGHCFQQVVTRQGTEYVRTRTVGTYDTYDIAVADKSNQSLAALNVTMDNTSQEVQTLSSCH